MPQALVVGSVALDTIETPHGTVQAALGGSCSYASTSASFFTEVSMVGVVGRDFAQEHIEKFKSRGIDLAGLEIADGKTFHWSGYYERDMNQAHTNTTELNVFANFQPKLTPDQRKTPFVFLANIHPKLQLDVLDQMDSPKLVALDTMNFWIEGEKQTLTEVFKRVDVLLVNEGEARQYCEKVNLIECGKELLEIGPHTIVIKKGEHGALMFRKEGIHFFPAYPLDKLKDPTGAGDTFAGGMIGYLARLGEVNQENLVRSIHVGTCMASFVVEDFSLDRLLAISEGELKARTEYVAHMTALPALAAETLVDSRVSA